MPQTFIGYGFNGTAGPYLHQTREKCIGLIQPKTIAELHSNVSACILDQITELDKALFSSRQYILTLWPAFVGAIVALSPDPSQIVYDNLWWSTLFALTCGGLPGLDRSAPPHHVEALSDREGRAKCESWQYEDVHPNDIAKTDQVGDRDRGRSLIIFEWISFVISLALYLSFCAYFLRTLKPAVNFTTRSKHWPRGATWYLISSAPALVGAILEIFQNRVEIFEPASTKPHDQLQRKSSQVTTLSTFSSSQLVSNPEYQLVESRNVFSLWIRIAKHQFYRTNYRILINDPSPHWVFLLGRALIGMGRVGIFATASIVMGNILFLPIPDDFYLFILLLAVTAVPRQIWSALWPKCNGGANLVVVVKSIRRNTRTL